MKVVTYNIQFGLGKDGHNDLERIAATVEGADIIALQEVERNWEHSGFVDQPDRLGRILSDYYWVYGPFFDVHASRKNPDGRVDNTRRQFGNMVLSKTPILSTRLFPLPKSTTDDQRNMATGMLEAVVAQGGEGALRVYNTHLSAKSKKDRLSQIHLIRRTIARAPSEGGAWTGNSADPLWREDRIAPPMPREFVLLGDFNHPPDGTEYDHLHSQIENECDLMDCWTLTGNGRCENATYFSKNPGTGTRIDFTFVDQTLKKRVRTAWIDEKAQGSDHQPFWIEMDDA